MHEFVCKVNDFLVSYASLLFIYSAWICICLIVCLYPINVKTTEPITITKMCPKDFGFL